VLAAVGERFVARPLVFARRADDGQAGRQRGERDVEAHLVVALARAAVRDGRRADLARLVDEQLRDERAAEGRRQGVLALVDRVGRERREREVAHEVVARVDDRVLDRARLVCALLCAFEVLDVAEVDEEADHLVAPVLLQPLRRGGGVEAPGVGKDDAFGHQCVSITLVCVCVANPRPPRASRVRR